jgi:hypothetical protein
LIKICPTCGKEFQVAQWQINKGRGKHCSRVCADKAKHNKVSRICAGCRKEFKAYPSQVRNRGGKFCSEKCYNKAKLGEGNPNHKGGKNIACAFCGKLFWVTPWRMSLGAKCCSKECADKIQRQKSIDEGHRIKGVCTHCGKEFSTFAAEIKKGNGKYCSLECYKQDTSAHEERKCQTCGKRFTVWNSVVANGNGNFCSQSCATKLEHNPRWLGGKSFEPYCYKFNNELKEHIRDKFGRRCVVCGQPENGRKLAVHHIDYNKLQGCKGKTWALVTLCNSCHNKSNHNRSYWFSLLINYWALNSEINISEDFNDNKFGGFVPDGGKLASE